MKDFLAGRDGGKGDDDDAGSKSEDNREGDNHSDGGHENKDQDDKGHKKTEEGLKVSQSNALNSQFCIRFPTMFSQSLSFMSSYSLAAKLAPPFQRADFFSFFGRTCGSRGYFLFTLLTASPTFLSHFSSSFATSTSSSWLQPRPTT